MLFSRSSTGISTGDSAGIYIEASRGICLEVPSEISPGVSAETSPLLLSRFPSEFYRIYPGLSPFFLFFLFWWNYINFNGFSQIFCQFFSWISSRVCFGNADISNAAFCSFLFRGICWISWRYFFLEFLGEFWIPPTMELMFCPTATEQRETRM